MTTFAAQSTAQTLDFRVSNCISDSVTELINLCRAVTLATPRLLLVSYSIRFASLTVRQGCLFFCTGHYIENTGNSVRLYLKFFMISADLTPSCRLLNSLKYLSRVCMGPGLNSLLQSCPEFVFSDLVEDISLNQWLALTPPNLVKAHLGFSDETISRLSKVKQSVVGPPH